MSTGEHEVVLLRHGETHGYHDDVGLTALGERQARDAGRDLVRDLPAGTTVHLLHAPTSRATATAAVLGEELAGAATVVGPDPDARFDSIRFLVDGADGAGGIAGEARESSAVAARRLAHRDAGDRTPDWVAEFDRFDSDFGALSKLGGPIDRWLVATTRHFEPPQVVVYRAWAGIADRAARAAPGSVTVIASHSALLRAVAAAAVGHDPGEPANLEAVRITVSGGLARVRYREHDVVVEVPTTVPPWLSPDYLA